MLGPEELARHPQPDDQAVLPEIEDEELAAAAKGYHSPTEHGRLDLVGCPMSAGQAWLGDLGTPDPAPLDPGKKIASDDLDFGQFRHRLPTLRTFGSSVVRWFGDSPKSFLKIPPPPRGRG
jgi:hypothetical protein